jgi:hypothetical protein
VTASSPFAFALDVVRPDDLLVLGFAFVNLHPDPDDGGRLTRIDPARDALVVVTFQPQHVQEQVFQQQLTSGATEPLAPPPVIAVAARRSRLAFRLPAETGSLAISLEALLDWSGWEPVLAANALPATPTTSQLAERPRPAAPADSQTSIELPYRLVLSPLDGAAWAHSVTPKERDGRVELWHTRLAALDSNGDVFESETADHPVRAVWTPDWSSVSMLMRPSAWPSGAEPLEPGERATIVRLSADFGLTVRDGFYPCAPAQARRLMLTSLGGWLDVKGRWPVPEIVTPPAGHAQFEHFDPDLATILLEDRHVIETLVRSQPAQPPGQPVAPVGRIDIEDRFDQLARGIGALQVAEPSLGEFGWVQRVRTGRDEYVEFEQPGLLWPVGHLASLITITERKFEPLDPTPSRPQGTRVGAYLRQRRFIKVTQPVRDYRASASSFPHDLRELPFTELRFTTLVTPDLDQPPGVSESSKDDDVKKARLLPFFPTIGGPANPYWFPMLARDHEGRPVALSGPLLFVPFHSDVPIADSIAKAVGPWNAAPPVPFRSAAVRPAPVAFAEVDLTTEKSGVTTAICHALVWGVATSTAPAVPPGESPVLPAMASATVSVPALAQVAGAAAGAQKAAVAYPALYLDHGFTGGNPSHLFLGVSSPLAASAAPDRSGGVAAPSFTVEALSKAFGPVGDAGGMSSGTFNPSAFLPSAKLFGALDLKELLSTGVTWPDPAAVYPPELRDLTPAALRVRLDDPAVPLRVPVLAHREVIEGGKPVAVESLYGWKPDIKPILGGILDLTLDPGAELVLTVEGYAPVTGAAGSATSHIAGRLTNFALDFANVIKVSFDRFAFTSLDGTRLDVDVSGVDVEFHGALSFVQTVQDILPSDGFSDPPFLTVLPTGITAGYTLDVPTLGIGVISIEGLALGAAVSLPFTGDPAGVRFAISSREHPFLVTVALFGGGGFFAFAVNTSGPPQVEAAIEFGGNFSLDIGVASGNVHVMAGIYFAMLGSQVKLSGYLRMGGSVCVLGVVTISVEFYLALTYDDGKAYGEATLSVSVEIFGLSKSVSLHVEKQFAGAAGDPTFGELVDRSAWREYCDAFATVPA